MASTAAATLITTWGVYGVVLLVFIAISGLLGWWLYSILRGQNEQIRKDLEAKYNDAAAGRDVLRELKTALDMNTRAIETAIAFLRGKV